MNNMNILKETDQYIVVDKPFGMESEHEVPAVLAERDSIDPGYKSDYLCIHRLDQAAGGLLVYAKTKKAAADLSAQLADGRLKKEYLAVVAGIPEEPAGTFHDLLYRDRQKQKMFPVKKIRRGVKEASLEYTVLNTLNALHPDGGPSDSEVLSLVSVRLHTGRFHQIRVQFASRGMPLVGDGKYGSRIKADSLALYCHRLSFRDPENQKEVFLESTPPDIYPWNTLSL